MRDIRLADYLTTTTIIAPLEAEDKRDAVIQLGSLLADDASELAVILHAIFKRESQITTSVGRGVALPHCRLTGSRPLRAALGVSHQPLNWEDGETKPVRLVFCLIGSEEEPQELTLVLQAIARLMGDDDLREALMDAGDAHEARRILDGDLEPATRTVD